MKAFIISQENPEGINDIFGEYNNEIRSILIPEANSLRIMVDEGRIRVQENFDYAPDGKNDYKIIKEIEVPKSFVATLQRRAREELLIKREIERIFAKELAEPPKTS